MLAEVLVGWAAALLVTRSGRPWILRLVCLLSRVSDPLLERVRARLPGRRAGT